MAIAHCKHETHASYHVGADGLVFLVLGTTPEVQEIELGGKAQVNQVGGDGIVITIRIDSLVIHTVAANVGVVQVGLESPTAVVGIAENDTARHTGMLEQVAVVGLAQIAGHTQHGAYLILVLLRPCGRHSHEQ